MIRTPEQIFNELLVLRCQDGESEALGELAELWQERLWRHARRMTADPELANDAMQEAWMAIVRGIGKLGDPALFRPWAYRIVTHKCTDQIRRMSRRRELTEEMTRQPSPDTEENVAAADDPPEIARLRLAMASLPADRRALLALHYLEELGIGEMAAILGIPEGTVKSRLFNARRALKKALERTSDEICK